jgi:hypothetical protein
MAPALVLSCGVEVLSFDDDEHVALSEMNFLYGMEGATLGRLLVVRTALSDCEVVQLATFLANVRAKLDQPLVVFDHGRGCGTVCFQNKRWYELVKRSGLRYQRRTPRYVKGEQGVLARVDVVYAKGRSVTTRDALAKPQALGDVPSLALALEKLGRAVATALAGAVLYTSPRETYEYF